MIDAHVAFTKPYSEEVLMEYIAAAQEKGIDELTILEPTHKFLECELLYKEIRASYPCQERWYRDQEKCSIVDYQKFITAMKQKELPIKVQFGLCVCYVTQHESFIAQMKKAYPYDVFIGSIEFLDNIAFSSKEHSFEMLWDKYNANFLYRRYYEMMNALLTSDLFDGVANFDTIKVLKVVPTFKMQHTFHKLAHILKEKEMYVEHDSSIGYRWQHPDNGLQDEFLWVCDQEGVDVRRASNATCAQDIARGF